MNFHTHVMFGVVVASIFYGKPEAILLVGLGSAIPDLDREYGFLSKESFRNMEIHRAVCHSFIFMGFLYLISPYLALGAFLHTLLDALTTARDRGVEWLFPFTRFIKRAMYDYNGERLAPDPNHKIYLLQNELPVLTKKTTSDIKPGIRTLPWRRTYGPALSGGLLDQCIFYSSVAITLLLILFSALGPGSFIDLKSLTLPYSFTLPFLFASSGVILYFIMGEIDRKKIIREFKKMDILYRSLFYLSVSLMVSALVAAILLNPEGFYSTLMTLPFIAISSLVVFAVSYAVVRVHILRNKPGKKEEPVIL
jgi:uncharacterized membrane protein